MSTLITIIVTFFAGMGAGLGTGFAGLSAAAVISPMLITFLGMDPYMAVGIALSSDVLASAVSAYTYGKNKNLDVKNGDRKSTRLNSSHGYISYVSNNGQLFSIYDIFTRNQVYSPSCHDNKGGHAGSFS